MEPYKNILGKAEVVSSILTDSTSLERGMSGRHSFFEASFSALTLMTHRAMRP